LSDDRWKELFEVRDKIVDGDDDDINFWHYRNTTFLLVERNSETILGEYHDKKYAVRQARHKYKKIIKMMEKKFMT